MDGTEREQGNGGDVPANGKYVVFCANGEDYGQEGYIFFTHEADVMMIAAAGEVESGKLTPAEARELLEPYREVLPPLYTGEQRMIFDPDRYSWDDPDSFPTADEVQQSPQASQIFWYEVDELGIEGVTLTWSVPFPLLAPVSKGALDELKETVSGEYKIVVKKAIDEFDAMGKSVEWARKLIEDAATTEIPRQAQLFPDTARFEGADPVGRALDDPALAAGRYIDDDIKNLRVGDKVRIYAPERGQEHFMDLAGTIISVSDNMYTVEVGDNADAFRRDQIELMPTNFNPHYGGEQDSEFTTPPDV